MRATIASTLGPATVDIEDLENTDTFDCGDGCRGTIDRGAIVDGMLVRCPACGTQDLFLQKDFPERIGVALVVCGVVLATIAWAYYLWYATIGVLVFFGAVDWILFHTRKDVSVCYRCLSQYRGMKPNPAHFAFDLAVGERYRQERMRREELRKVRDPIIPEDEPKTPYSAIAP